ncbi:MAG TPA: class I SAM-dependent methyltransferase [Candidatus Koribacter sp.]|jgi:SAM-dependent methyltransferase
MGRFSSTANTYARYREPYTPEFFSTVARELQFGKSDKLLDVACGPGLLAIGFAPSVARVEGVDPEPNMLAAAREAAANAGTALSLHKSRLEDFVSSNAFDVITIGRALHWLDRDPAIAALDRLLAPAGRILVCGASTDRDLTPWAKLFIEVRERYAALDHSHYGLDGTDFFAGSPLHKVTEIRVPHLQTTPLEDVIQRSHTMSNTSPEVIGDRRADLERELRALLTPYAHNGNLEEHITGVASVFARSALS